MRPLHIIVVVAAAGALALAVVFSRWYEPFDDSGSDEDDYNVEINDEITTAASSSDVDMTPIVAPTTRPPQPQPRPPQPQPQPRPPQPRPPQPQQGAAKSPYAGRLLADLPIDDLLKPKGGAWNVMQKEIEWKKGSGVRKFEGESVMRVFYGKGSGTSKHKGGVGGIGFDAAPRGLPTDAAVMTFDVYFEPGWHFSHGGKLTGWHMGSGAASGGRHTPDAASCRMSFFDNGSAHCYIYVPAGVPQVDPRLKDTGTGNKFFKEDIFTPGTLKVGQWNHVELGVKLNTFDSAGKPRPDGIAMLHINGKMGVKKDIRWARKPENNLKYYVISSFFGGSEPAVKDCAALFRNFRMYAWK